MPIYEVDGKRPKISPDVTFIADTAVIIGDVEIGPKAIIFDNVVLEGFPSFIRIGENSNLQSGVIVHTLIDSPCIVQANVTIGHGSILHGCTLEEYSTVGIGSLVMGYSILKRGCFLGAKSLVTEHKEIPECSLALGHPAKVIETNRKSAIEEAKAVIGFYQEHGKHFSKTRKLIS
jgi:carbonic anhydrase/acetyltransferase-like protein (isoleucine patch superfamily)